MVWLRWCFLALVALSLAAPHARAAEPFTIRAAWASVPGQMFPILMQMKNVLVHYGKSYVVEAVRSPGSGPQTTALASGDLNLAYFAPSAFEAGFVSAAHSDAEIQFTLDAAKRVFGQMRGQ